MERTNPFANSGQQQMMQANPMEYPAIKCTHCGCEIFQQGFILRNVPGSVYGQAGRNIQVPVGVMYCTNCRALSPQDQEAIDEWEIQAKKEDKKSSIIVN